MSFLTTLWLPIILSAVFVFIVSSIIHMFFQYHRADYKSLPREDELRDVIARHNVEPGDYIAPRPGPDEKYNSPEFQKKVKSGPVFYLTVIRNASNMSGRLIQWFAYSLIISIFAAYLGDYAVPRGGDYLDVFRVVGTAAFMGYSLAFIQDAIWKYPNWGATFRSMFDGLIYALVTAGTFGWLWP